MLAGPKRVNTQSPSVQRERYGPPGSSSSGASGVTMNGSYPQHLDPRSIMTSPGTTPTPSLASGTTIASNDPRSKTPILTPSSSTFNTPTSSIVTSGTTNPNPTPSTTASSVNHANGILDKLPTPTQLKVKVSFENNYVTLVVALNISYQSLVDRIDAKLSRFTSCAIGRGSIRLRYRDEDGDYVTIRSDEDILMAFSDWKEQQRSHLSLQQGIGQGGLGEIQLFCQSIENS